MEPSPPDTIIGVRYDRHTSGVGDDSAAPGIVSVDATCRERDERRDGERAERWVAHSRSSEVECRVGSKVLAICRECQGVTRLAPRDP